MINGNNDYVHPKSAWHFNSPRSVPLKQALLSIFLCVTISACATKPHSDKAFNKTAYTYSIYRECNAPKQNITLNLDKHVLVSDSQGDIMRDRNGERISLYEAFSKIAKGYFEEVKKNQAHPLRLLFYFNGGLNSQAFVEAQAERQIPCMMADGYYPVFFIWDTDALNSYWEQVSNIYDGYLENKTTWIKLRAPFLAAGQIVSGLAQMPIDFWTESARFNNALFRNPKCHYLVATAPPECQDKILGQIDINPKESTLLVDPTADNHQLEVDKFVSYSAFFPIRLITSPIAHGWGEAAWRNFLRRTRTTIRQSWTFKPALQQKWRNLKPILAESYPQGTGIFAEFFEVLNQYRKPDGKRLAMIKVEKEDEQDSNKETILCKQSSDKKVDGFCKNILEEDNQLKLNKDEIDALNKAKITLIGHSMGAIVVNELVEKFPELPYSDIVVMASAASIRDTQRVINHYYNQFNSSHQPKEEPPRFFSLMLHPLNDARERQAWGAIPSGSLLLWIDEMYEVPKTPGDRTFGFWPNIKAARGMFSQTAQQNMLYRVFNRRNTDFGEATNPVEHGDFNNDSMCFWRPAFWGVNGTAWGSNVVDKWKKPYDDLPKWALEACISKHPPRSDQ